MNRLSIFIFFHCVNVIAFLLASLNLYGQQKTVSGIVTDTLSVPLNEATISFLDAQNLVVNYTFTNQSGNFKLTGCDKCAWINISFIGYKSQQVKIDNSILFYNIRLQQEPKLLKEIVVKNRPTAKMNGDTLSYLVSDFSSVNDKSIGDVLKHMPGLEVANDGSIYFNGKKIENLYIEGDDVMDGRYGMATKVIKKDLIKSVDIINHHQPINVLKNKVFTDNVAVNLVLQNENSLQPSGTSQLGTGFPGQIETSIAPVLLSKKLKIISLAGYNNAGIDYKNDIKQQGGTNFLENMSAQNKNVALSLSGVSPPDIPLNYYYFNNSAIVSFNTLYKTKNDIQFKWNSNIYSDKNHLEYQGKTINYLANDTISYFDKQKLINKPLLFSAGLNIMMNKGRYFLSNSLRVSVENENHSGGIDFNGYSFSQFLHQKSKEFSNDFDWIPAIKNKGIAEIRWYTSYSTNRQQLDVEKYYFFDVSPQNNYYDIVKQLVKSPTWFHNAYLSYKIPAQKIYQEYRLGYKYLQQELNSNLSLINNNIVIPYINDSGNDVSQTTSMAYLLARYQIKFKKFRSDVQLPLFLQQIKLKQPLYMLYEKKINPLFSPDLRFTYHFNNERYIQAVYQLQNVFGDITTAYKGAILLNYRSLQSYTQSFQQQKMHKADIMYSHQKSIKLFYSNIGLSYDHTLANTIQSDSISSNINHVIFIPDNNGRTSVSIYAGVSQYLFKLKTKAGIKVQRQLAFNEQFVNSVLLHFQSNIFSLNVSADKNIGKILLLNYNANLSWQNMKLTDKTSLQLPQTKSFSFDQQFRTGLNFFKQYYIETKSTYRINKWPTFDNTGYFFLDANAKRQNLLRGLDVELNCYNLLNVKSYNIFYTAANQIVASNYRLRGRIVMLKATFNF